MFGGAECIWTMLLQCAMSECNSYIQMTVVALRCIILMRPFPAFQNIQIIILKGDKIVHSRLLKFKLCPSIILLLDGTASLSLG